jgi:hypothetical protein
MIDILVSTTQQRDVMRNFNHPMFENNKIKKTMEFCNYEV